MENLGMIFCFYSDLQQIITINARRTNLMGKNVVLNKHFIKDFIKRNHAQLTEKQEKILLMIADDETLTSQKNSI